MSGSQRTQIHKTGIKQKQALISLPICPPRSVEQRGGSMEAYKCSTLQAIGSTLLTEKGVGSLLADRTILRQLALPSLRTVSHCSSPGGSQGVQKDWLTPSLCSADLRVSEEIAIEQWFSTRTILPAEGALGNICRQMWFSQLGRGSASRI